MAGKAGRRDWGFVRKLPSGRIQASYQGPDGARHTAPNTFGARIDADAWLVGVRKQIDKGEWKPATGRADDEIRFGAYADAWLAGRDLKPRTRAHYRSLLDARLLPTFGHQRLADISPAAVRLWHSSQDATTPTMRAHAYALLRTIFTMAVADEVVPSNPCRVAGAGTTKRAKTIRPATLAELETITAAMPERLQAMVLIAAWGALRFGELAELRRGDIDVKRGLIRIRRGVVRVNGEVLVGTPKTTAGQRDVNIPPHLMPMLEEHLRLYVAPGKDALLFPATDGRNYSPSALDWHFRRARAAAGRPDLRFHDLRHTGAVLAASTGATLAELMARLGHTSPAAALRYQHAAADRDRAIAEALSSLVTGRN
ncbi:MAG: site-specific integrase [Demequina sp.]|nr:site-specific integrase [Demequina sp.]